MENPHKPSATSGCALTNQEAWLEEFKAAFREFADGKLDENWLDDVCRIIYSYSLGQNPRYMANLMNAVTMFEVPASPKVRRGPRCQTPRCQKFWRAKKFGRGDWRPRQ